eukprot:scaffold288_cov143-Ochromonas_danica.AAC.14
MDAPQCSGCGGHQRESGRGDGPRQLSGNHPRKCGRPASGNGPFQRPRGCGRPASGNGPFQRPRFLCRRGSRRPNCGGGRRPFPLCCTGLPLLCCGCGCGCNGNQSCNDWRMRTDSIPQRLVAECFVWFSLRTNGGQGKGVHGGRKVPRDGCWNRRQRACL